MYALKYFDYHNVPHIDQVKTYGHQESVPASKCMSFWVPF